MNSTFKITPAGDQLDIIQYTAPPPAKPRRRQVLQHQDIMLEKCSLPDLTPNSLFDAPGETGGNSEVPDSSRAVSPDAVREIPGPLTSEADIVNLEFAADESGCEGDATDDSPNGARSSQPLPQGTPYTGLGVLDEPAPFQVTPKTSSCQRADPFDSVDCGDVQDDNASAGDTRSDDKDDSHGVGVRESGSEEPGLRYDDLISSDTGTSENQKRNVENAKADTSRPRTTQESLRSAEWRTRPVIPAGQSQCKQSSPEITLPRFQPSATIKVPRHRAGISSRRSRLEGDHPSLTTKRKGSTMSGPLYKRKRQRVQTDTDSSDSDFGTNYQYNVTTLKQVNLAQRTPRRSRASKAASSNQKRHDRGSTMSAVTCRESGGPQRMQKVGQEATALVQDAGVKASASSPSMMLTNLNVHPVRPTDFGYLTALIEDITNIGPLLETPAAFGLTDDIFNTARLINAGVKPLTPGLWLLTATISRATDPTKSFRDTYVDTETGDPSDDSVSDDASRSSGTPYSIHHCPFEMETDIETSQTRRGRWSKEEDEKLRLLKLNGDPWSEIYEEFPGRTEGAVKARWYIVLAPNNK